ncbi:MAG TPA: hypothetical protein DIU15_17985, partial [Deltaproteobacteria bacterium]|nr:hypothetical protein [Deltaproteobacteria bacterium]
SPSEWSYFACEPALWIRGKGSVLEIVAGPRGDRGWLDRALKADPGPGLAFDRLTAILDKLHLSASHSSPTTDEHPQFRGGLIGCFSYDLGRQFEDIEESLPSDPSWDFHLGLYDEVLAFRAETGEAIYHRLPGGGSSLLEALSEEARAQTDVPAGRRFNRHAGCDSEPTPELDESAHREYVETIRSHIRNGDVYQVNLTFRFSAPCSDPDAPLASFVRLRTANPSPFGAYLNLPDCSIVSA